jgi:hypothetical protein
MEQQLLLLIRIGLMELGVGCGGGGESTHAVQAAVAVVDSRLLWLQGDVSAQWLDQSGGGLQEGAVLRVGGSRSVLH